MLSIAKEEENSPKTPEISKPSLRRIPQKVFSLEREEEDNINNLQMKYQPFKTQPIYRHDATTWIWLSKICLSRTDLRFQKLTKLIESSKKMHELNIEYSDSSGISDTQLNFIAQRLKSLACLKTFRLRFYNCGQVTDYTLYCLSRELSRLSSLEHLSLSFYYVFQRSKITDKGVCWLGKSVKRFARLKSLRLGFDGCSHLSDIALKSLSFRIKNLRLLECLSLSFSNCYEISNIGIKCLSESLKRLCGSLKSLRVNFFGGKISDVGLKYLQEALEKLVWLRKVKLKFNHCFDVTHIGLEHLIKGLGALTLLKDATLCSWYAGKMTASDVACFSKALKRLQSLENARVDFRGLEGSNELCFQRKNQKTVKASFQHYSVVSNIGLENFCLREFVYLQKLSLSFWHYHSFTELELKNFSRELECLVLLQDLYLDFSYCSSTITEKGFISICEGFEKLKLLQNFELDFHGCTGIARAGGAKLCESLREFGNCLKVISWNFDKCNIFGGKELQILYESLKNNDGLLEKFQARYGDNQLILLIEERDIREKIGHLAELLVENEGLEKEEVVVEKEEQKEAEVLVEKETERVKMGSEHKEEKNESRSGRFRRLFGCFSKKQSRKQKGFEMMGNNQL